MEEIGHHKWDYYYKKYPVEWENYYKIGIVRNPWDRVVSTYEYAKMDKSYHHATNGPSLHGKHIDYDLLKNKSFTECIDLLKKTPQILRHQGWGNQYSYIHNGEKIVVDKIIKLENLNKDLSVILNKKIKMPYINKSNNNNYKSYYENKELTDSVKKHYIKDITYFNYEY